jgi:hypothetical protein
MCRVASSIVGISTLLLVALSSSWVGAWGGASAPSDKPAVKDDEKELVRRGSESFLRQDYEGARASLQRAYELNAKPDTILKLAIAELQSGHPVEAVAHLREYLTHTEEPQAKLEQVRTKWLPRAEAATARLDVFASAGSQVLVDGVVQERAVFSTLDEVNTVKPTVSIVLAAGEHDVAARQGTVIESKHVVARGGELVELHFQRVPDAPQPALAAIGSSPAANAHDRLVQGDGLRSRAKWITTIAFGSVAVAAVGIAIGFSIAFEQSASDASALRQHIDPGGCRVPISNSVATQCSQLANVGHSQERNGALANAFYVAGGAAAILGVAGWVLWPKAKSPGSGLHPVPIVGEGGFGGMALSGTW